MSGTMVVEMAPFAVAEGVTDAELLEASERLEREFLSRADGYVGRILARVHARQWADIVLWKSEPHVTAAMARAGESPACAAYFACMSGADHDQPGQGVSLFHAMRAYGALGR